MLVSACLSGKAFHTNMVYTFSFALHSVASVVGASVVGASVVSASIVGACMVLGATVVGGAVVACGQGITAWIKSGKLMYSRMMKPDVLWELGHRGQKAGNLLWSCTVVHGDRNVGLVVSANIEVTGIVLRRIICSVNLIQPRVQITKKLLQRGSLGIPLHTSIVCAYLSS